MILKKITTLLTAACFFISFTVQSFAQDGVVAQGKEKNSVFSDIKPDIISEKFGKITEFVNYDSPQVIVNIQDLHSHAQTQKNIAEILRELDEKYSIKRIYLEGAGGKVDISWLLSAGKSGLDKNIVLQMLENGTLTGAEYFAFLNKKDNLFGLEDVKIHRQNIVRLGSIYENEKKNLQIAASVKNEINYLVNKNLGTELKKFLNAYSSYRGNKIESAKYYKILLNYADKINLNPHGYANAFNIDTEQFTEIKKVVSIDELSKKLNVKIINSELQKYVSSLKDNISISQYYALLEASDNLNDIDVFLKYAAAYGFDEKDGSQLKAFIKLKELNSQINPLNLFNQEQKLEELIRRSLASSEIEKEISFLNDFYIFFEGYLTNALTAKDEEYFKNNFNTFRELYGKYTSINHINEIKNEFEFLNDYYRTNNKRNEIFVQKIDENDKLISGDTHSAQSPENILNSAEKIIITVTGGYHTIGVNEILDAKKISHITITPRLLESSTLSDISYKQIILNQSRIFREALAFVIASQTTDAQRFQNIIDAAATHLGKDISFDEINKLVEEIDSIAGSKSVLSTEGNNAKITFNNGAVLSLSRGADNEIIVNADSRPSESVSEGSVAISEETVVDAYVNMAKTLTPEAFKSLYRVAVLDIESEPIYEAAKKFFKAKVAEAADFGVEGAVPALEDYALAKMQSGQSLDEIKASLFIDGISYEQLSKMPEFFQKEALKKQISKDKSEDGTALPQKRDGIFKRVLKRIGLITIVAFIILFSSECNSSPQELSVPPVAQKVLVNTINKSVDNAAIRKMFEAFTQNNPFPRSYLGNTDHLSDPNQKLIAGEGVIVYDMTIALKPLLLNPKENEDLIGRIIDTLYNESSLRSNKDFDYNGKNIPVGQGYFWKILNVRGTTLKDQYLPITGESAHLVSALAWVYSARNEFTRDDLGNKAYEMMNQLGKAMLALQIPQGKQGEGLIVMAPEDKRSHYSYMERDFNKTVSVENNISAYNALKLLIEHCDNEKDKQEYAAALERLEKALIRMYDKTAGYFNTGLDTETGEINTKFATDCQTWIILAMGADRLNKLMGDNNFSMNLLKRTLQMSGVKNDKGEYIGLDFYNRLGTGGSVVSFEWTFGFVIAAQHVLRLNPDADLKNAVDTIKGYARSQVTPNGLYKYTNSEEFPDTGFGWKDLGMISLASSAWVQFLELGIDPFSIVIEIGEKTITLTSAVQPEIPAEQPISYGVVQKGEPDYYNGPNWAVNSFRTLGGKQLQDGNIIRLKYNAESPYYKNDPNAPKFLLRLEYSNRVILFTNSPEIASKNPEIMLMTKDTANNSWNITLPETIPNEAVKTVAVDFGYTTAFFEENINTDNNGNPQFTEMEILEASPSREAAPPLELPYLGYILNKLGITNEKSPKIRAAIIATLEMPLLMVLSSERFTNLHGANTQAVNTARMHMAEEMKERAKEYMRMGAVSGATFLAFASFVTVVAGIVCFGPLGIGIFLSFLLSTWALVVVGTPLTFVAGIGILGMISLIHSHYVWNIQNPKRVLDNNVQVNMIFVAKNNLEKLQQYYGTNAKVNNNGTVSQNVYIINDNTNAAVEGFSNSGINVNGKTVWVKSLIGEGIIYYANGVPYEEISAAIQNKKLENRVKQSLRRGRVFLGDNMNADYLEVDAVADKTGTEYDSISATTKVYVGVGTSFMQSQTDSMYFEHIRDIRNAEGWQRARSVLIFLNKTKTRKDLEKYLKILRNASNGNIIITEELAQSLLEENKFETLLEQLRKDGISVMIEKTPDSKLPENVLRLFDGKFNRETGNIESAVPGEGNIELSAEMITDGKTIEETIKHLSKNIVIFETAIDEYIQSDRAGLGGFLEEITSVKILKHFVSAAITADSAAETARNFDIEKILYDFPNITRADVEQAYKALLKGESAENIFLSNPKLNVKSAARMYLEKINERVEDKTAVRDIKKAYMLGLMEKLAAAVEFKETGRLYGFKNKNIEKLFGKLALFKYLPISDIAEAADIKERIENMTAKNYNNEITSIINDRPQAIPAVADLMLQMIFYYESEVKMNKGDFKKEPDLKAISAILSAA
ncbi:MAG: hypothetical protein LBD46_09140 [Endomicrobium sp.]|jgi:hypothetical protein|nr:hypothetical protein [Endomicrobium sp.]